MELDMMRRHVPAWHDESAHNRVLATHPPDLVLDPGFCFPEDSEYYEKHVWKQTYEPRLVARVKTPEQREAMSANNLVADDWKHVNPAVYTPQHAAFIKQIIGTGG